MELNYQHGKPSIKYKYQITTSASQNVLKIENIIETQILHSA